MLIRELVYDKKSIFQYMNEFKELDFIGIDLNILDGILRSKYGNRKVSTYVENVVGEETTDENMKLLGAMLSTQFHDKWKDYHRIYESMVVNNDIDITVTETITDDTDRDNTSITKSSNDTTESMTGYNTPDFIDTDRKDHTMTSDTDSKNKELYNRQREVKTIGSKNKDDLKIIKQLTNLSIYDMMLIEVVREVGTLIF